ncbi:MAG TPA: deoxyribodipyrimidine photo-lyase [Verrucomicrobiae bacterium]|nr:deoxyribodipyrimidine photo-lyase [Verrucomicrobiae bacterium]
MDKKTALVWYRRDLRMADNPALVEAARLGLAVVPVFIWAPEEEGDWAPGGAARVWLHESLKSLQMTLKERGLTLLIKKGPSLETLLRTAKECGAEAVFWNRCYEPALIERDKAVKAELQAKKIEAKSFSASLLFEPWEIKTQQGTPYKVFTPFWNQLLAKPEISKPLEEPKLKPAASAGNGLKIEALELLPSIPWDKGIRKAWTPGESRALQALEKFSSGPVNAYETGRDRPDETGTSRLSPHLHFGEISPRQIWHALRKNKKGLVYLRQIAWREFAYHLLYHFPHTPRDCMRPEFRAFPWERNARLLKAWQKGGTGYPIVDAGMRELWATGWMHNRVRMIAASFLVKDLLVRWQEGAAWFWDTLVDADLANNTLGWQWVGGCGADAAPYFRIFNPVSQGKKFDPQGVYVRRWVPELAGLDDKWIHEPWKAPAEVLEKAGVKLGRDYPEPGVDHEAARRRALMAYEKIKSGKNQTR